MEALPKEKQAMSNAAKGVAYCDKLFHLEKQFALLCPENRLIDSINKMDGVKFENKI